MGNLTVVRAMAEYDGLLWIAGNGGQMYTWDGVDMTLALEGDWSWITDLVVFDGLLWAAVTLPAPGGGQVWCYDGVEWIVDGSIAWPRTFLYLREYDGDLYVVTDDVELYRRDVPDYVSVFDAGGGSASNMVVYDGLLWLARGPDGRVYSFDGDEGALEYDGLDGSAWNMASYAGELWVGLEGTWNIFRYDGVDWTQQVFKDFRRVKSFRVVGDYLFIGTGYYARVYAWDGQNYVLDYQPPGAKSTHDTHVMCEYGGDLYIGTNIKGGVFVRRLSE